VASAKKCGALSNLFRFMAERCLFLKQSQFWGATLTCFYQQHGSGIIITIIIIIIGGPAFVILAT